LNKRIAQAKVDKKWGYIDKTRKMVIEPKFEEANDFSEGRARRFSGGSARPPINRGTGGSGPGVKER